MSLHFTFIEDVIDSSLISEFNICSGQSDTFCMTRLQCAGNILADVNSGPRPIDSSHYILCLNAIRKAIENNSDILITPEYSIPFDLVTSIVQNASLQPGLKKILCLSCEATTIQNFRELITIWEASGAYVVQHALNNDVHEKNFVNALIYVFKLNNNQLCILPQLKTKHMADRFLRCEAAGLTLGSTIYVFGRNNPNRFCSLICADSLHSEINRQQFQPTDNEHIIIFHPQLNPHPRQSAFTALRKGFYNFLSSSKVIYITANWAEGTIAQEPQSSETINFSNPWSCIYIKNDKPDWFSSSSTLIKQNYCFGIGFSYWKPYRVNIWYSFKEENMQVIHVKKPNLTGACALQPSEVVGIDTYIPSAKKDCWEKYNACFNETLPSIISNLPAQFDYPYNAAIDQRDRFFGLCLGHFEEGQYIADDSEICPRLGLYIDDECQHARNINARNFMGLVRCLDLLATNIYPQGTPFSFGLSTTYKKYNIFPVPRRDDRGMLATYVECDFDIKKVTQHLRRNLHETEYKRSIILTFDSMQRSPQIIRLKTNNGVSASQRKKDNTSIVRS